MYTTMAVAHPETVVEITETIAHGEAVARLATIVRAMMTLDRLVERCTDPLAESCLLALRAEHEVRYLETLYAWACEGSEGAGVQPIAERGAAGRSAAVRAGG